MRKAPLEPASLAVTVFDRRILKLESGNWNPIGFGDKP
jgi:hypothetical protein